ncbi:protease inhibitor I42 family protein [Bacillus cereus]|nr:protease inhibitor I42 family protein [Bacillus cereus]
MILSEKDTDKTFHMNLYEIFTLNLKENPTTGYRWFIEISEGLKMIEDNFKIGEMGLRIFKFQVIDGDLCKLKLKNWRDWEGDSSIIDKFKIQIIVK